MPPYQKSIPGGILQDRETPRRYNGRAVQRGRDDRQG